MSDADDLGCTPPEIAEAAKETIQNLLPTKSVSVYEASYNRFLKWCSKRSVKVYSENVLLVYFTELSRTMKSSSLWSNYSMIRSSLHLKKNVDISKYLKLHAFLKKQGEGFTPKKAKVLTKEEFETFLREASDEKYLETKVILIFGISGAMRCDEIVKLKIDDIEDHGSLLLVNIPDTKTGKKRSFTIIGEEYLAKYRQYVSLRPEGLKDRRFFIKYQNGKCAKMVMGIHTIGNVAKTVAMYLQLPNYMEYTGHSLRRTSATLLVDGGADLMTLKRHGGWRSSCVAEGYIDDSLRSKQDIARKILMPANEECDPSPSISKISKNDNAVVNKSNVKSASILDGVTSNNLLHGATITNCVFNINVNTKL